jgi:glycosyltransferase involved in cell wall biosynthesis
VCREVRRKLAAGSQPQLVHPAAQCRRERHRGELERGTVLRPAQAERAAAEPSPNRRRLPAQDQVYGERRPVEEHDRGGCPGTAARDAVLGEHVAASERLELPGGRGCGAEGLAVLVQRACVRREDAAPTGCAKPQREVDVLPVGEERVVEAAELGEGREAVRGCSAAGPDGVAGRREVGYRTVPEVVPRAERRVELDARGVDQAGRRSLEQNSRHHPHRVVGEGREEPGDEVRRTDDVVVDQDDDVGVARFLHASVDGPSEAEVLGVVDDRCMREARGQHLPGAIGRRVIDNDNSSTDRLRLQARESLLEPVARVQRRDDDDGPHEARHDTRMVRVVMWSTDPVGERMAGPGIRYHRLSTELAQRFDVTLVAPGEGVPDVPYTFRRLEPVASDAYAEADVVVAQGLPLGLMRSFRRTGARLVFDLYAPALVEAAANLAEEQRSGPVGYGEVVATTRVALLLGDGFLCASERQRDHWLGALAALGRVSPDVYAEDPTLRSLVAVVPFGLDPSGPGAMPRVKGVLPGIAATDRLLLWGGGIWNWFDPLTVIRAVGRLAELRSDVKLLFLGLAHPSSAVGAMSMAERAVGLAGDLGLEGSSVFFNRSWVPYDERLEWFAEADIGVSAHHDSLEARLAFRTRLLDHIAAGTPVVVTRGDVLADLIETRGLGRTVRPGDVDGWVDALRGLLDDARAHSAARKAVAAAQEELAWARVVEPLTELIERVAASPRRGSAGRGVLLRAGMTLARSSLERRGLRQTVAAASRSVSGGRRR